MSVRIGPCLGIAACLCLLTGFGFSLIGVDQLHQAQHSSVKPVDITCSRLRSYRPGSNIHITLTKFVPYPDGILALKHKEFPSWSVWVPVLPADAAKADPKYIVAVVQLSGVSDTASLRRRLTEPRWTGMLYSQGELEPYAASICRLNPGINFGNCWVMWEGHNLPDLSSPTAQVIACACLFVLGMVLAVLAALWPDPAPDGQSMPLVGALGDAVRWLHRRGFLSGRAAILLAAAGLAAVGAAGYVINRDWDHVVRVTTDMHLAVIGGLIGLGLLAYAVLIGYSSWRRAQAVPAPARYQLVQGANIPVDRQQMAVAVMVVGLVLLAVAGNHFYRSAISNWTYVFAVLGGLVLAAGIVWCGFLGWKKQQEPAHFWNKIGPNNR